MLVFELALCFGADVSMVHDSLCRCRVQVWDAEVL